MSGRRAKPLKKNLATGDWVSVTRLQAARQQLDTAIALYFLSDDAISRHTLLYASIGILNPMLKARGGPDLFMADRIDPKYHDAWLATLKESSNFFKHGKKEGDPNESVHFMPTNDEWTLSAAIEGYGKIAERITENMVLYIWWIKRKYPELYTAPLLDSEKELLTRFPDAQKVEYFRYCKWVFSPECNGKSPQPVRDRFEVEAEILMRTCPIPSNHTSISGTKLGSLRGRASATQFSSTAYAETCSRMATQRFGVPRR